MAWVVVEKGVGQSDGTRGHVTQTVNAQRVARFEAGLSKLAAGLARPRSCKNVDRLRERIGRLKERYAVGQDYRIEVATDAAVPQRAISLTWQRAIRAGSRFSDPGVYCLRTNLMDWDEETLWRTYTLLTDLAACRTYPSVRILSCSWRKHG
jgi:hypothetical protein